MDAIARGAQEMRSMNSIMAMFNDLLYLDGPPQWAIVIAFFVVGVNQRLEGRVMVTPSSFGEYNPKGVPYP